MLLWCLESEAGRPSSQTQYELLLTCVLWCHLKAPESSLLHTSLPSLQGACQLESTTFPFSSCFLVRARPCLARPGGDSWWTGGGTGDSWVPFPTFFLATAPTSFEGPFGKIVHQVRATIDTPRFSKDHQCSRVFYILSPLNLNSIPDIEVRMKQWSPG